MSTLVELHEPVAAHLKRVEAIFEEALSSDVPVVGDLCGHVARLRGKMLRPVLLLLSAQASGHIRQEHDVLAAVVEMVHMATLVHDDVLDEADIRRRTVTVNRLAGNEAAVMLGDFLISRSFRLCSSIACQQASQLVSQAAATVCEGELLQLSNRGNWQLDEETYLRIVDHKTAALTAVACQLGALYAGADPVAVNALHSYGRSIGIAFQMIDDVLDIAGREDETGKTLGTDARNGKLTLPVIHHLRAGSGDSGRRMRVYLENPAAQDRAALHGMLTETDSLAYARRRAAEHIARAVDGLECLPPGPARAQLRSMAEFTLARQF